MAQTAYVNGRYLPAAAAGVSIEDRGFQFADGIYEVFAVFNGRLLDADGHFARLTRGYAELGLPRPMSDRALGVVIGEIIKRNRVREGIVYLQVTRGVARRDHPFPVADTPPTLVLTARSMDMAGKAALSRTGVRVSAQPDIRWGRCDIKTVGLLPNVLAKQAAKAVGAFEALFVDNGTVTEGGSTNMWMVDGKGRVLTHPNGPDILPGIMRQTLIDVARAAQIEVVEQAFTLAKMRSAAEAFLTSTTAPCLPVVQIDGDKLGKGVPGPVTTRIVQLMWHEIARQTGYRLPPGILG